MIVVDASVLVAALAGVGSAAEWSTQQMRGQALSAPSHAPFEAANVLRRLEATGDLDRSAASLAHDDLQALPIDLFPFEAVASRAWALRHNATIYDAAYLALAEVLDATLVTFDHRLAAVPVTSATVVTPTTSAGA